MTVFGLIGKKLSHSFSKSYFESKFQSLGLVDHRYDLFELETISEFPSLLQIDELRGLNVTIPYKQDVIQFLDEVDDIARRMGAVNVIKITGGKSTGYNSDYFGFRRSLEPWLSDKVKAIVLGTGGASKAVKTALEDMEIPFTSVSRNPQTGEEISYEDIMSEPAILTDQKLVINCTPLGMYPDISSKPELPYHVIGSDHYFYDLVYNPEKTAFLQEAERQGARIKNGLEMLELQAEKSWEIWTES